MSYSLIRERFSHMGAHSGYDLLCPALERIGVDARSVWLSDVLPIPFLDRFLKVVVKCVVKASPFYGSSNLWTELNALRGQWSSPGLTHILYGENNLGLYSFEKIKRSEKLVVTVHQPFSWWEDQKINITQKLKTTDALIVLSSSERDNFTALLGDDRVHFVPHGVDTDFFSPPGVDEFEQKQVAPMKRCLFVGQWLRDFDTLFGVIELVLKNDLDFVFDLVVPDISWRDPNAEVKLKQFEKFPQICRYQMITDETLLGLYRNATLLILPLEESTANNAVLEAMSCGLPIVTNETTGIVDYTESSFANICPAKDAAAMVKAMQEISRNRNLQISMSNAARDVAVDKFAWRHIAVQIENIYRDLL